MHQRRRRPPKSPIAHESGAVYRAVLLSHALLGDGTAQLAQSLSGFVVPGSIAVIASFIQWDQLDTQMRSIGVNKFIPTPLFATGIFNAINDIINDNISASSALTKDTAPDFSGIKLLLVEDIDINREIFIELMSPTGIDIDIAHDGIEAVQQFKRNPDKYDIIIMDVQMPVMNGYEATSIIRSLEYPRAQVVPIIAMSANVFKEDIEKCHQSGMNDHIPKPIEINTVIDKIEQYLNN